MKTVFLGGTCNNSQWREALIPLLKIDYFNPVVDNWTPECQAEELKQRAECDFCLYVITPKMTGSFSIAEVTDDSNKRPEKTVFCYLPQDYFGLSQKDIDEDLNRGNVLQFTPVQLKSLKAVATLVQNNGAKWFQNLQEVADYINSSSTKSLYTGTKQSHEYESTFIDY